MSNLHVMAANTASPNLLTNIVRQQDNERVRQPMENKWERQSIQPGYRFVLPRKEEKERKEKKREKRERKEFPGKAELEKSDQVTIIRGKKSQKARR